jgi:hypothetical protein
VVNDGGMLARPVHRREGWRRMALNEEKSVQAAVGPGMIARRSGRDGEWAPLTDHG